MGLPKEKATFAAGCFWGVEVAFRKAKGVISTRVGYTGGNFDNPTYKDVCSNKTGHAEAVEVIFDPRKIKYEQLLALFWSIHDPTQVNRQKQTDVSKIRQSPSDVGSQYRSVIFYHGSNQKKLSETSMKKEQKIHTRPIATKIVKAQKFWPAEKYHQDYYGKQGGVCRI